MRDLPENRRDRWVTRRDFGDAWPLTVDAGTLSCWRESRGAARNLTLVTFTTPEGKSYALNGQAQSWDFADIDSIWAHAPDGAPLEDFPPKKNLYHLKKFALSLCEE